MADEICIVCGNKCEVVLKTTKGPTCCKSHQKHVEYLESEKDKTQPDSE